MKKRSEVSVIKYFLYTAIYIRLLLMTKTLKIFIHAPVMFCKKNTAEMNNNI